MRSNKARKTNKRRNNAKPRNRSSQQTWQLRKNTTGIADQVNTKLHYEELISINPAAPRSNYVFRGNSCYDPNYTGVGHQPGYFDYYSSAYNRFRVIRSDIYVEISNTNGATPILFTVIPDTDPVSYTAFQDAAENPRSKVSKILPVSTRIPYAIRHSITTRTILGLKLREVLDLDYSHTSTGNPNSMWYWNIFVIAADSATNMFFSMRVKIIYHVQIFDRIDMVPSLIKLPDDPHSRDSKTKETSLEQNTPVVNYIAQVPLVLNRSLDKKILQT